MEKLFRDKINKFFKQWKDYYPDVPTINGSPTEPLIEIDDKKYLIFCSNNYLGLATADFVKEAAINAIEKYGFGSAGSRWVSGTTDLHRQLEIELAKFKHKGDALSFSAGFMTNSGVIPALTGSGMGEYLFSAKESAIFSDELNHASIIDGCTNSKANKYVYRHKDMEHLEELLEHSRERFKLIVTDGVFSMDGDIAPLDQLVKLAKKYKAMTMVDEAHAVGVIGKTGRGTAEYFDVEDSVDISMGTLSKTFGSLGGYVASDNDLIDYLRGTVRTYIFSAAMPACNAAAVMAIIKKISTDFSYTKRLQELIIYFRDNLKSMGLNTLESETAIIPIFIGDEKRALELSKKLFEHGIYLSCALWPAVERDQARLRATITANHQKKHVDQFLNILETCL